MKKLIVVDISSFIFRAFFAIRSMNAPDGTPVNAVYGVLSMLLKLLASHNPSHIILARDTKDGSFRKQIYPEYKANRGPAPDELIPQFALIEELIEKMKLPNTAIANYEADDIIGSIATQFKDDFDEILIASGDKDLMQFIGGSIKMLDTMKDKTYGREEVLEKMGVYPEQVVDYLSLLGDTSDNIPGVKGIGAKGASKLLAEYKTLDEVIKNIENIANKRAKTALENYKDNAYLSKSLVEIVQNLDVGYTADEMSYKIDPSPELMEFLDKLSFNALKSKLTLNESTGLGVSAPRSFVDYHVIKDEKKYKKLIDSLSDFDQAYVELFFDHDDYHKLDPKAFGIALGEKNYILYASDFNPLDFLIELSRVEDLLLISSNTKSLFLCLYGKGEFDKELKTFDLTQAHFVLDPEKKHNLQTIAMELISESVPLLKDLRKENFEDITSLKNFEIGFTKRIYAGIRVYPWLFKKLKESDSLEIYETLDAPLMKILALMEFYGISLDTEFYGELEKEFTQITEEIEKNVFDMTQVEVNLKSPKQVRELLFEKLSLPVIKKTKTGPSTDSSVLEALDKMGESEVPGLILKYREIEKLNSTYVKSLPTLVHDDGKLHTHFNQHVAATGRLSSDSPNLQNIPIRTDNGRKLRKGFKAKDGHYLLGADYSQVELRLLAHFSEDKVMLQAFQDDLDIHKQTASEIFGIELDKVTKEKRSYAKAINFGLMYGQSSFGLSQMLGISRGEANQYITEYFSRFSSVKGYLDSLKEICEEKGYTQTLFGRKRYVKDITSTNRQVKSAAERVAINTPIQGTAADIIKKAMLNIDATIKEKKLTSKMLLQVHDELIFEVPESELEQMKVIVQNSMENVVKLRVPLKVDMAQARNWYELK